MITAAWHLTLRARDAAVASRSASDQAEAREQYPLVFVASLVFAVVIMFLCFAIGLSVADSGNLGGDGGVVGWCLAVLGSGIRVAALEWDLTRLGFFEHLVQYVVLVTVLYSMGVWWIRRRASRVPRREDSWRIAGLSSESSRRER
jgi:hypothetical protein